MVFVQFFVGKIPGLDSLRDAVHASPRIPRGALLAAAVSGDSGEAAMIAAGIVGGMPAAGARPTESGSRPAIDASPEAFGDWAASLGEAALVAGGVRSASVWPALFLVLPALCVPAAVRAPRRPGRGLGTPEQLAQRPAPWPGVQGDGRG